MITGDAAFDDDEPASRLAWLRAHRASLERIPCPGAGLTVQRLRALADLATADGSLARLAEGHLDAVAILDELGHERFIDATRGVWAARPEQLSAEADGRGWVLRGTKPWCSGADGIDRALVTATAADGTVHLFDVATDRLSFDDDWHPIGMRASDSRTARIDVRVDDADRVGRPGAYVERPGFGHGGVGVAACWHGLARRLACDMAAAAQRTDDPHLLAVSGRSSALLAAASALLGAAGRQIDEYPQDTSAARRRAFTVRVAVEQSARAVLQSSVAAQGASALCFDHRHGRAVSDLMVYLGQLHHGHDAAAVRAHPGDDWWSS